MEPTGRPSATIKAHYWHCLDARFRPLLGAEIWGGILRDADSQPYGTAQGEDDLPLAAFNRVLRLLEKGTADVPDGLVHQAADAVAERWGRLFRALVLQLQGRPEKMLDLFVRDILPHHLNRPPGQPPRAAGERSWSVTLENELPEAFQRELLVAFLALTGAQANVKAQGAGSYEISWRFEGEGRRTGLASLLVATVRVPFLTATIVPVLVALAIAADNHVQIDPLLAALTLLGVCCFQFATTAINDYYDRMSGVEQTPHIPNPFDQRGRRMKRELPRPQLLKTVAYAFYALGISIGLVLITRGIAILWLGLAGFLLGFLYSAPPVRLAHRGLGELAVAVGFGPLIVLGTYFVQAQAWSLEALLASLPLAFTIAAVLYINEFPDREGDARVGKRTLIVRLPEKSAVIGYVVLLTLTYVVILGGVALKGVPRYERYAFPPWSLLGLLTLPLAGKASVLLARNYRYPYRLIPANAHTIMIHLATGLLFSLGYLIALVPSL